ncbi:redox-active disulfide protein 2 [Caldimicrobium thiodismutans]|uniref:Redox-active disulfide protein 2 n=1 Tax=Caldimicrobium thiodismutans TaxID=1653476 RepID=A0A0U4W3S9_9BACT|nr:thioredoxin family protein [Caldimicrobium thiodismutans]BAU23754.1 redox-active disulfide protein 2 [Caldimicrobium thiodismutans]
MKREIKVLGPGCPKCELLYENVVKALDELGIPADLVKIKDFMQIAAHGVLTTPGLVIDGKLVSQGKVLSVEEIKELLKS